MELKDLIPMLPIYVTRLSHPHIGCASVWQITNLRMQWEVAIYCMATKLIAKLIMLLFPPKGWLLHGPNALKAINCMHQVLQKTQPGSRLFSLMMCLKG